MILGVSGSPRNGATEYILKKALHILECMDFQTKFFTVRNKTINFCQHCDYCLKKKVCVLKDDMFELYPFLKEANGIIFATPVYNGGISAQTKAIMDRCRALSAAEKNCFQYKAGIGIAVGGDRNGGQELALQQIITFYILNGIVPLSGGTFGANLGATFWSRDRIEGTKTDEEGFKSLKKTLNRFAEYLKKSYFKSQNIMNQRKGNAK